MRTCLRVSRKKWRRAPVFLIGPSKNNSDMGIFRLIDSNNGMCWGMARASTTSDVFNAVAEPQRRRILELLRRGECPVGDVASSLRIAQPRVSKHLRVLRAVGLVRLRPEGRHHFYSLDARGLEPIHKWTGGFMPFWNERFDKLNAYGKKMGGRGEGKHGKG